MATTSVADLTTAVLQVGRDAGLDAVGVAAAAPFTSTLADLERRKDAGLHGGMQFTYRNPARSSDPRRALPNARSLVVGALRYQRQPPTHAAGPAGRVANYVWEPYYEQLAEALNAVAGWLRSAGHRTRVLVDDNALVDREAAYRAGLGWYGKNANLLLPGQGSMFVLGSVLTTAELEPAEPSGEDCGTCDRCITGCPTGAIVAPGVVDARRCLAWLVQQDGDFPLEYRTALGDRLYGCDDCQEVCPPNRRNAKNAPAAFSPHAWVPLLELLAMDDQGLLDTYGAWYIPRREPRYLRRNALVALGNVGDATDPGVRKTLERYLCSDDAMLQRHARWAAENLGIPA